MSHRAEIRLFIAAPSDCNGERGAVKRVVEELNRTSAQASGFFFQDVSWEDVPPIVGKHAQAVIDDNIGPYDLLIGIMWLRYGTPLPGKAESGTEHEVNQAIEKWTECCEPRVMCYFKDLPPDDMNDLDPEQFGKVRQFRDRLQGSALVQQFRTTEEFERKLRIHLQKAMEHFARFPVKDSIPDKHYPSNAHELPPIRGFYGRTEELQDLRAVIVKGQATVILVQGISGIGKTALCANFASTLVEQGYQSLWLDCRSDTSVDDVIGIFVGLARTTGSSALQQACEDPRLAPERRAAAISDAMADASAVVFLDDYHQVRDPLVHQLIEKIAHKARKPKVVLICRQRHQIASRLGPELVAERTIRQGLSVPSCAEYLHACGLVLSLKMTEQLWTLAGEGHPKALEIFVARSRLSSPETLLKTLPVFKDDLKEAWLAPLFEELPAEQRQLAIDLSAFERDIPFNAMEILFSGVVKTKPLVQLIDRFILDQPAPGLLRMHFLIRDYCYDLIATPATQHEWIANYYLHIADSLSGSELMCQDEIDARIAAWSQYLKAGNTIRAREQCDALRPPLMKRNQYEQTMFILENTPATAEEIPWVDIHKARILSLWDERDIALETIARHVESLDVAIAREAVLVTSTIYLDQRKAEQCITLLREKHTLFDRAPHRVRRRVLQRSVEAYCLLGKSEEALSAVVRMVELAQVDNDELGGCRALRQMAIVLARRGEVETALQICQTSKELAVKNVYRREEALSDQTTGEIHLHTGREDEARRFFQGALSTFVTIGDRLNVRVVEEVIEGMKEVGDTQ